MMTLREVSPARKVSSSSTRTQTQTLDPNKAKLARRRRLEIQKLRSSSKEHEEIQNGVVEGELYSYITCESHGAVSIMGRRREMEDTVSVELGFAEVDSVKYDFFGVYDGHGGSHVADTCRDRMHSILVEEVDTWRKSSGFGGGGVDWERVMVRCFERMDKEVGGGCGGGVDDMEEMTVGSTAVTAVVGKEEVVIANCGDSRAIICRNGVAMPLSFDHKPDRPDELARIEAAGGRVINWNGFRVLGVLATSRSIGDHYLKPYVSSTPEVTISKRREDDEFLILATDGLWDVISNNLACQVVRRCLTGKVHRKSQYLINGRLTRNSRAEIAAALLAELAMAKGSKDNISVIVIELGKTS